MPLRAPDYYIRRMTAMTVGTAVHLALAAALAAIAVPTIALSQQPDRRPCNPTAQTGAISGRVTETATGRPPRRGSAAVRDWDCWVAFDSSGLFTIAGLDAGTYQLVAWAPRMRAKRLTVRVGPDSVTNVSIALDEENWVLDCMEAQPCARLLSPDSGPPFPLRSTQDSLQELVLRSALALSFLDPPGADNICVAIGHETERDSPPDTVLQALSRRQPDLVSVDRCEIEGRDVNWRWRVRSTRESAWLITGAVSELGAEAVGSPGMSVAALWAVGWSCEYRRVSNVWRPVRCRQFWIR